MRHQQPSPQSLGTTGLSRRKFLSGSACFILATAVLSSLRSVSSAFAQSTGMPAQTGASATRYVLRNAVVLSMDPEVGNFPIADVLIEGTKIAAIGPDLDVGDAQVIDATGKILMPGFIDTHHHQFETALRSTLPEALLFPTNDTAGKLNYMDFIIQKMSPLYRPEDAYSSIYLSGLSQLDAGVTTVVDTSQINHSPDHSESSIAALKDVRRRAVKAYSEGYGPETKHPAGIRDLVKRHFSSADQLLTIAMGTEYVSPTFAESMTLVRELDLPIVSHLIGNLMKGDEYVDYLAQEKLLGSKVEFIHATNLRDETWKKIADSGAGVSIAAPIEMTMRHGSPPVQTALDNNVQPSLSTDVETTMTADMFTQMRSVYVLQRNEANQKALAGATENPTLLTPADVIRFATVEGARVAQLADKIGSVSVGKDADIILLDARALNTAPLNNVPGAVVTLMERSNVDTVIVAGAIRKWAGELVDVDVTKAIRDVEASRDFLLSAADVKLNQFE